MKNFFRIICFALFASFVITSCAPIDLYEKSVTIPGHEWNSSYRPAFNFTVTDSLSPYKIFLVLRHSEKYAFNNIYVNLYIKGPGQDTAIKIQKDIPLATNEKGWLGSGMDDIYEHRSLLAQEQTLKAGNYSFVIEQIMREDPLKDVLNVGLRLEKEK